MGDDGNSATSEEEREAGAPQVLRAPGDIEASVEAQERIADALFAEYSASKAAARTAMEDLVSYARNSRNLIQLFTVIQRSIRAQGGIRISCGSVVNYRPRGGGEKATPPTKKEGLFTVDQINEIISRFFHESEVPTYALSPERQYLAVPGVKGPAEKIDLHSLEQLLAKYDKSNNHATTLLERNDEDARKLYESILKVYDTSKHQIGKAVEAFGTILETKLDAVTEALEKIDASTSKDANDFKDSMANGVNQLYGTIERLNQSLMLVYGRGFAVLHKETHENSKEIKNMLDETRNSVERKLGDLSSLIEQGHEVALHDKNTQIETLQGTIAGLESTVRELMLYEAERKTWYAENRERATYVIERNHPLVNAITGGKKLETIMVVKYAGDRLTECTAPHQWALIDDFLDAMRAFFETQPVVDSSAVMLGFKSDEYIDLTSKESASKVNKLIGKGYLSLNSFFISKSHESNLHECSSQPPLIWGLQDRHPLLKGKSDPVDLSYGNLHSTDLAPLCDPLIAIPNGLRKNLCRSEEEGIHLPADQLRHALFVTSPSGYLVGLTTTAPTLDDGVVTINAMRLV